jgi:hypothetical protein
MIKTSSGTFLEGGSDGCGGIVRLPPALLMTRSPALFVVDVRLDRAWSKEGNSAGCLDGAEAV